MNVIRFPVRRAIGLERSINRAFRWEEAERMARGLLRLAENADAPMRERLTTMAYTEGAKADVLRALSDGRHREAREALTCWRILHRTLYPRKGGRA